MLNIKALAFAAAVIWGACFLFVGLGNLVFPPYGDAFLQLGAAIYPGYHGPAGFGSVIVATLYALVDGAIAGLVFGWLYNTFGSRGLAPK
jgi:hypothetical protein